MIRNNCTPKGNLNLKEHTMSANLATKAKQKIEPVYSLAEEVVNSLTHGIGAALSIAGMTLLLAYAALDSDPWKIASFAIYGVTLTLLYLASTLYHRSEEHTSELQSRENLVCRLLLEKKKRSTN